MRKLIGTVLLFATAYSYAMNTVSMTMTVDSSQPAFTVTLPSNPTTGYQWTVTRYDKTLIALTGSQFIAPKTKLIGAGGNMKFTFARLKGKSYPQSTLLSFTYARSWAPNNGTVKQVMVNFVKNKQH